MVHSNCSAFSESESHTDHVDSRPANGSQSWSPQLGLQANDTDSLQRIEHESSNAPLRRSTAPTTSSAPRDRQSSGSVLRAQTTYETGSSGTSARRKEFNNQNAAPNVHGFPEIGFLEHTPSRHETFNTYGSGSFDDTEAWDQKSILSLDGGGIRGYSSLLILQELMRHVGVQEQRDQPREDGEYPGPARSSLYPVRPPKSTVRGDEQQGATELPCQDDTSTKPWLPCHYFDYMAGTSTGGLISIMLGRLRMNIDDCIEEYEKLGSEIFANPRKFHFRSLLFAPREKYNHKVLKDVIQKLVNERVPKIDKFPGGKIFASDENRCRVVVVSYQEDKSEAHQHPYLFRTYKNIRPASTSQNSNRARNPGPAHDIPIWQVARATSAAPTYFKEVVIEGNRYIDGGFGTNNPCKEIVQEVRRLNNFNDQCIKCVISVGTGLKIQRRKTTHSRLKTFLTANLAKFIEYIQFSARLASQSEDTHDDVSQLHEDLKKRFEYDRFNVNQGIEEMKLDEWKARGPLKVRLGKLICKMRQKKRKGKKSTRNKIPLSDMNGNAAPVRSGDNHGTNGQAIAGNGTHDTSTANDRMIPNCLRSHNKTLCNIRDYTTQYLRRQDIQDQIQRCAKTLVEIRRRRIQSDEQRWRRTCFGTWYQCRIPDCPRGETEYHDQRAMYWHLFEKHRVHFPGDPEQSRILVEKKVTEFEVVMQ